MHADKRSPAASDSLRVLIAPTAFKGTAIPTQAAERIARGWRRARSGDSVELLPVADGGDGTAEVLHARLGGRWLRRTVRGPLGDSVDARALMLPDGGAVVEMAVASGLVLVPEDRRDPRRADTRGTGEIVSACFDDGARTVLLGLGGSATVDGGAGYAHALGVRFRDDAGRELEPFPEALARVAEADRSAVRSDASRVEALSDVRNPLLGPRGAAAVYGPQKGASPQDVAFLSGVLERLVAVSGRREAAEFDGAGAAGGLGFGVVAFGGGRVVPGADRVLDLLGFDDELAAADVVATGEGKIDDQTPEGKVPAAVARRASAAGIPCIAIVGIDDLSDEGRSRMNLAHIEAMGDRSLFEDAAASAARAAR